MEIFSLVEKIIFKRGAVQFEQFQLKSHEKDPNAPLSPFFFNLRTEDNPKPGPLTEKDCQLIAACIWQIILKGNFSFDAICGIPNAGVPFVKALEKIVPAPRGFRVIPLSKITSPQKRKIIADPNFNYRKGERIVLVDDVITGADTKLEAAEALKEKSCVVAALAVLVDRQQGGREKIEKGGCKVISVFKAADLFEQYAREGKITQEKMEKCLQYIKTSKK